MRLIAWDKEGCSIYYTLLVEEDVVTRVSFWKKLLLRKKDATRKARYCVSGYSYWIYLPSCNPVGWKDDGEFDNMRRSIEMGYQDNKRQEGLKDEIHT